MIQVRKKVEKVNVKSNRENNKTEGCLWDSQLNWKAYRQTSVGKKFKVQMTHPKKGEGCIGRDARTPVLWTAWCQSAWQLNWNKTKKGRQPSQSSAYALKDWAWENSSSFKWLQWEFSLKKKKQTRYQFCACPSGTRQWRCINSVSKTSIAQILNQRS